MDDIIVLEVLDILATHLDVPDVPTGEATTKMPYRRPGGRRTSSSFARAGPGSGRAGIRSQYTSEQTVKRRHEYQQNGPSYLNVANSLAPNEWIGFDLAKFHRTFSGSVADVDPTATASNNYQTSQVMNGSHIQNMKAKVTIKNLSTTGDFILDVYLVSMSFYDALTSQIVYAGIIPHTMETSGTLDRGNIDFSTPSGTNLLPNSINNYKGVQRLYHHLGSVELTQETGSSPNAEININHIPEKCRRSQTGMYYGIIISNSSAKNNALSLPYDSSLDVSFDEIPSAQRLPFLV